MFRTYMLRFQRPQKDTPLEIVVRDAETLGSAISHGFT